MGNNSTLGGSSSDDYETASSYNYWTQGRSGKYYILDRAAVQQALASRQDQEKEEEQEQI